MKAQRKATARPRVATKKVVRKTKLRQTAGTGALTRKRDILNRVGGYTGDRGDARSATSGIP